MTQESFDWTAQRPTPLQLGDGQWRRFAVWHEANPRVWDLFVQFTFDVIRAGRPYYSARDIVHRIRWHTNIEMRAVDEFKINNNWSPYYARLFVQAFPEYEGFFEMRSADSDPETERRLVASVKLTAKGGAR